MLVWNNVKAILVAAAISGVGVAPLAQAAVYGRSGGGGASLPAGTRVTASVDQASLATGTITGASDGGYELEGEWLAGTAGDTNLLMRINGVSTGYSTGGNFANASGVLSNLAASTTGLGVGTADTTGIDIARAGGASGRDRAIFRVRVAPSDSSGSYQITIWAYAFASASGTGQASFDLRATVVSPTGITSISFVTSNGSSTGIRSGSYMRWRPLKFTAWNWTPSRTAMA